MSDISFSRPLGTAQRLGDDAPDRHRFIDKRVLLTIEPSVVDAGSARGVFLDSVRLLVRTCRHLVIDAPSGSGLAAAAAELVDIIAFGERPLIVDGPTFEGFDAILNIGGIARPELPWTVISADGWLARVSSGAQGLPYPTVAQANPVAVLAAASLGVTEVFKRLVALKPGRGALLEAVSWSLMTYAVEAADSTAVGPLLPDVIVADGLAVIGVGAIGNGHAHVLAQLPLRGRVWVVDRQVFGEENLGTCILLGPGEVGEPKAVVITEWLRAAGIDAVAHHGDVAGYAEWLALEGERYPTVILNGLDTIDARHEVQGLWPDVIIDGAIGDFMCQAGKHPLEGDVACLQCAFVKRAESALAVQARASGLAAERLLDPESIVSDADVARAPQSQRPFLEARRGRKVCAVVSEAVIAEISTSANADAFAPSVPFVACLSAAMDCAELVKTLMGLPTLLEPRFQFDVLCGPALGAMLPQARRAHCDCVSRRGNIDRWRAARLEQTAVAVAAQQEADGDRRGSQR